MLGVSQYTNFDVSHSRIEQAIETDSAVKATFQGITTKLSVVRTTRLEEALTYINI